MNVISFFLCVSNNNNFLNVCLIEFQVLINDFVRAKLYDGTNFEKKTNINSGEKQPSERHLTFMFVFANFYLFSFFTFFFKILYLYEKLREKDKIINNKQNRE